MKKIKFLGFALLLAGVMASCCKADKVNLVAIDDVVVVDMANIEIVARIDNQCGQSFKVKSAKLTLKEGENSTLIEAALSNDVIIPRKTETAVAFPISMRMPNPLGLLSLPRKLNRPDNNLNISGEITVKAGLMKKTHKIGPMSLREFLYQMGTDEKELMNSINL